ncbi:MAG: glycosyltransferase [Pseudomonadota bacterium]
MTARPLKVLLLSSLWPNREMPTLGIFVHNRMSRVAATGAVDLRVMAPVKWFPLTHPRFGRYAVEARVPRIEQQGALTIHHPRYPMVPKLSEDIQPSLYYRWILPHVRRMSQEVGGFDLIDAQYFYPDAVAARWMARDLGLPFIATARGTDVNYIPKRAGPRRQIRETAQAAAATVAVSEALRQTLIELGAPAERAVTLRNGVDLNTFAPPTPEQRCAQRAALGVPEGATLIVSVGALIERKGHALSIQAMADLPGTYLAIAGDGPDRAALMAQIQALGLANRVRLVGPLPYADVPGFFGAADASLLASSREGLANVLLESMACGTPALATPVYGAPEVITAPAAGRLLAERSTPAIVAGVRGLVNNAPERAATRAHAERFGWEPTVQGTINLYSRVSREFSAPNMLTA